MIGYVRHMKARKQIQSDESKQFCLILDCYEDNAVEGRRAGHWMERVLNGIECLTMYDEHGDKKGFPAQMCPGIENQAIDERWERIASDECEGLPLLA